jgi:hypothetical protein
MKRKRAAASTAEPATTPVNRRRALRGRPTPRWLTGRKDLDEVAQRRCLLVLSVLSGEKPVTAAIAEMGISRPLYYQLESKALLAMLAALAPGVSTATSAVELSPAHRMATLEDKVAELEQDKRRLERLLFLTRKVVPPGPVAFPRKRGRKPKPPGSTNAGRKRSRTSMRSTATSPPATPASIPTPAGVTTP